MTFILKTREVNGFPFAVEAVELNRNQYYGRIILPQQDSGDLTSGSSVATFLKIAHGDVAINGSFLKSYTPPIPQGLLTIKGSIRSALVRHDPVDNGVLCLGEKLKIYEITKTFEIPPDSLSCLQVGPVMVLDKKVTILPDLIGRSSDTYRNYVTSIHWRSFVAVSARYILVGASTPIDIPSLAKLLVEDVGGGGFGASSAISMPSSNAVNIVFRGSHGFHEFGQGIASLPDAVVFERRHEAGP